MCDSSICRSSLCWSFTIQEGRKEGVQREHRLPIFGTISRRAVLINAQSRFPIVVLDSALEPLRLFHAAFLTVSLFLSSSGQGSIYAPPPLYLIDCELPGLHCSLNTNVCRLVWSKFCSSRYVFVSYCSCQLQKIAVANVILTQVFFYNIPPSRSKWICRTLLLNISASVASK